MRYSITYLIGEGFRNVMKNKKGSIISLITMLCAMFLFGSFFVLGQNINDILHQVQEAQGMEVFIENEATDEQINHLKMEINSIEGVNTIDFKSKQQALDSMKESFKDSPEVMAGYEGENNIFPASFVVTLTDLNLSREIQEKIVKMDSVKEVTIKNKTIDTLLKIARGINTTIGIIFIILLIIAITIITNTIKLSVHARRKEISIMKYVGATNSFIRWPFMIEGMIIGIVAAALTIAVLAGTYQVIINKIQEGDAFSKLHINLLQFSDMSQTIIIVFLVLGIGIGVLGSRISMKKYLEV